MNSMMKYSIKRSRFWWLWVVWLAYFGVVEGVGVYEEFGQHKGDGDTFTHFVATQVPMGARVVMLAWLAYHFTVTHKNSVVYK